MSKNLLGTVIKDITEDNKEACYTGQDNTGYNEGHKCKCVGECDCE